MDLAVAKVIHQLQESCHAFLTPILKVYTFLGNYGWFFVVTSIVFLFFKTKRKMGIHLLLSILIGFICTNLLLKNLIHRARPYEDTSSLFYEFWVSAGSLVEHGYSFPSGHTTTSMAFATALFFNFKKKYSWLFFLIPLFMGLSRIYFVVHYASDVLGGLVVGFLAGLLAYYLLRYLLKKEKIRKVLFLESKEKAHEVQ